MKIQNQFKFFFQSFIKLHQTNLNVNFKFEIQIQIDSELLFDILDKIIIKKTVTKVDSWRKD